MTAQEALKQYQRPIVIIDNLLSEKDSNVSVNEFTNFVELGVYLQKQVDAEKR